MEGEDQRPRPRPRPALDYPWLDDWDDYYYPTSSQNHQHPLANTENFLNRFSGNQCSHPQINTTYYPSPRSSEDFSPPMGSTRHHRQQYHTPREAITALQRTRAQSVASGHMGAYLQPQSYTPFRHNHQDAADQFNVNDFSSLFNSSMNLNNGGTFVNQQPRNAYQSPTHNTPNYNREFGNQELDPSGNGYVYNPCSSYSGNYFSPHNAYQSPAHNTPNYNLESGNQELDSSGNGHVYNPCSSYSGNYFLPLGGLRSIDLYSTATDAEGYSFLLLKFKKGYPEEAQTIFNMIRFRIHDLMVNPFGSCLVQKIIKLCNDEQMDQLVRRVIGDIRGLLNICCNVHGNEVMQELLQNLRNPNQQLVMISALSRITLALTKNSKGHKIISCCLKCFSSEQNKRILNEIADDCLEIATHKLRYSVIFPCLAYAEGEPFERLIAEITANALFLSQNEYGNYVVQHVVQLKLRHATYDIVANLAGNFVLLSMDKYGSNVVEKVLIESEEEQSLQVVNEIVNSPRFVRILIDPYGNYVVQSMLQATKEEIGLEIANRILNGFQCLKSHPHGKNVLKCASAVKHAH